MRSKEHTYLDWDCRETISNKVLDIDQDLIVKTHNYKSGSIYNGEWLGGFRHGNGTIKYPDGSHYKGEWNIGKPHG